MSLQVINLNDISKAAFKQLTGISKSDLSIKDREIFSIESILDIKDDIYELIKKYPDNKDYREIIIKILNNLLSIVYINNIDLNSYIQVITDEEA